MRLVKGEHKDGMPGSINKSHREITNIIDMVIIMHLAVMLSGRVAEAYVVPLVH